MLLANRRAIVAVTIKYPPRCRPNKCSTRRVAFARLCAIDSELAPIARSDARAQLLQTIPGVGPLIGLTFATEIGEVSRFGSPAKLIGYAGLAPRIIQSGERSATGRLSKAGSRVLRWAAVEAATQACDRPIPSTSTTAGSPPATAPTRRRSRSPASS
jgi:Transposase IS116/IS110/IS902 family